MNLPEWIVESHGVDDVGVLVEREQLFSGVGVPDLAGSIVRAGDEPIASLVEGAVRQGKQMGSQGLEQSELLHLVLKLLFDELLDELFELGFARRGN